VLGIGRQEGSVAPGVRADKDAFIAELPRLSRLVHYFLVEVGQDQDVGLLGDDLGELRAEVGVAVVVGLGFHDLAAELLEGLLELRRDSDVVRVRLIIEGGRGLGPGGLVGVLGEYRPLEIVGEAGAEEELPRLRDVHVRRPGGDRGQVGVIDDLGGREAHRRVVGPDDAEDAVVVGEFLHHDRRLGLLEAVVQERSRELVLLAADRDAAGRVDLVHRELDSLFRRGADNGEISGEFVIYAELDRVRRITGAENASSAHKTPNRILFIASPP
jgi:hypothetical protein